MIEQIEKDYADQLKADAYAEIAASDRKQWRMIYDIDAAIGGRRLESYIEAVERDKDCHALYEVLAVARFLRMLKRYEVHLHDIVSFAKMFESLPFEGSEGRSQQKLSPVQVFMITNIYGFYADESTRVTKEVLLFVPRKFGKTTFGAAMCLYDVLCGDKDAQAYFAANSKEQADVGFRALSGICEAMKKEGEKHERLKITASKINFKRFHGIEGFIRSLTNSPNKLDGLKASLVVTDEISQAPSMDMKHVITSSMGTRKNHLAIDITTASDKPEGPFTDELENFKKILRKEEDDDSVFAMIFEPDVDDDESDPKTWRKVHPHLGVTVFESYYEEWHKKSLRTWDDAKTFRTKLLNLFVVSEAEIWIKPDVITSLMTSKDISVKDGQGFTGVCAYDLSISGDLSSLTISWYNTNDGKFYMVTKFYYPANKIEETPNRALYKHWAEEGWLTITPGDTIDYNYVSRDIIEASNYITFVKIGYDSYRNTEVTNNLKGYLGYGLSSKILKPISQTLPSFTAPVEMMQICINNDNIRFDRNPMMPWCFSSAILMKDTIGNAKPVKAHGDGSKGKVDGVITVLMCLKQYADLGGEQAFM